MQFSFGFYSSLLLIFFVHGLVYALLLLRKGIRNETKSDKWLSLFLLLCVLYISPWMLGFGGWYDTQPYRDFLFYTPLQHLFFVGPVMFFYVQSLLNPSFRFGKREWLHLLPGLLYLLFCLVMVLTDKLIVKRYYFLANGEDPDFDTWYQVTGFMSMLFYFILSLRYYNLYRRMIVQVISYAGLVLFKWVRNFLYAFLCMLLVRFLFYIASFIPAFENFSYAESWWLYFSFAIIYYYIAITGYSNTVETQLPIRISMLHYRQQVLLEMPVQSGAEEAAFIEIDTEPEEITEKNETLLYEWKPRLEAWMTTEKAYEDPELTLLQAAKRFGASHTLLSKMINQGFGQNFNDFVNQYRVEAVKRSIEAGAHQSQTLLGIAFDCGFNSKATFNRAFKKATGMSPKEWVEKITKE